MKNRSNILILGDSTSVSMGADNVTYPFLLSDMKMWNPDSEIANISVPGLTASDACAIFYQHFWKTRNTLSDVIIYLGNCDPRPTKSESPGIQKSAILSSA
jgi:hypothetical protein